MARKLLWGWSLVLTFLITSAAQGQLIGLNDGFTRMFGISARSTAMGGAMVGIDAGGAA